MTNPQERSTNVHWQSSRRCNTNICECYTSATRFLANCYTLLLHKRESCVALQNRNLCSTMEKAVVNQRLTTALPYLAERTGLEPATPGVTGRYSNQLNYHSW